MLSDLIARLFVAGFFVAYLVVAIFLVLWIVRTWLGGERRPARAKSTTLNAIPQAEPSMPTRFAQGAKSATRATSVTSGPAPPRSSTGKPASAAPTQSS